MNRESKKPSRTPIHPFTHFTYSQFNNRAPESPEPQPGPDGCPPNTPAHGRGGREGRPAVAKENAAVERAIRATVKAFQAGGRLIYVGAGTSGRLGVLDASECPPTFSVPHTMVQGSWLEAARLVRSKEGAEDRPPTAPARSAGKKVGSKDMVLGITAIGLTPFVAGALEEAKRRGAAVWLLTCNREAKRPPYADGIIRSVTGPEVLTGSHPPQGWDGDEARPEPDHDDLDGPPQGRSTGT